MKTILDIDTDEKLIIDTTHLDNLNYVELTLLQTDECGENSMTQQVPLDDLIGALHGFDDVRIRNDNYNKRHQI